MIIVKFYGGLGNQMLEYASYVALQERYPTTRVMADIRKYNYLGVHNGLELERLFPIRLNIVFGKTGNVSGLEKYWHYAMHKIIAVFFKIGLNKFRFVKDNNVLNRDLFHLDTAKNYYLEGYWGNEKYFENAKELVKQHFTFKIPLDSANEELAQKVTGQNSVSVHIRRGDYISEGSLYVDLSKTEYYLNALKYITAHTKDPVFYIFSNEIEWCRTNLTWLKNYQHYFVKGNEGKDSYRDMQIMSLCKHNIIANSSFSWWGGWLNNNPGKIVICPKNYIYDETRNDKILSEFYPGSWVKM